MSLDVGQPPQDAASVDDPDWVGDASLCPMAVKRCEADAPATAKVFGRDETGGGFRIQFGHWQYPVVPPLRAE